MKFRKLPIEIDAAPAADLIRDARSNLRNLPQWVRDVYEEGNLIFLPDAIIVKTLEGDMTARASDWLISGIEGEVYPCKPEIFAKTYEAATEAEHDAA